MRGVKKPDQNVSVVIPNYQGEELLKKNLAYVIKAKKFSPNKIKEIVIVDDGSTDESVVLIKNKFPEVKLFKHRINRGFTATANTGVRMAKGELIALLNNDVLPTNNFLVATLPHFKDKSVFAVSLHEKGYGWAGGAFESGFIVHHPGRESRKTHPTFWVSGGSGVFRRSYWMKLGGMDESLFSPFYWEDLDLCYRAAKRGLKSLWEPKSLVYHKHESTITPVFSKRYVTRIKQRNYLLFNWKNITSPTLFKKHIAGLLQRTLRHPGYIKVVLNSLTKIRPLLKQRKREKKECKVSDEAIFASF